MKRNRLFATNSDLLIPISLDSFLTMTFVRSKNISLKYQRFTTLGSKDIGIRKSEFVAKSQLLYFRFFENRFQCKICNIFRKHITGLKA